MVWQGGMIGFFESVHDFKHGSTATRTKIIDGSTSLGESLHGFQMTESEIDDVNVITNTGTVTSIIIITINSEFFNFATSDFHNDWHEIVWNTVWIFTKKTGFVSANWIEVTQNYYRHFWTSHRFSFQDFFDHVFGFTVWISNGDTGSEIFTKLAGILRAVNGSGRAEDDFIDLKFSHTLQEIDSTLNVGFVIFERLFDRFSDCL